MTEQTKRPYRLSLEVTDDGIKAFLDNMRAKHGVSRVAVAMAALRLYMRSIEARDGGHIAMLLPTIGAK